MYVVDDGEVEIYRERSDGTEEPLATVIARATTSASSARRSTCRGARRPRARTAATLTSYTTRHFRRRFPTEAASTDA